MIPLIILQFLFYKLVFCDSGTFEISDSELRITTFHLQTIPEKTLAQRLLDGSLPLQVVNSENFKNPTPGEFFQQKFDSFKRKINESPSAHTVISGAMLADGITSTTKTCVEQNFSTFDCHWELGKLIGGTAFQYTIPGNVQKWMVKKFNLKLLNKGVFQTDAVQYFLKTPVTTENFKLAKSFTRRPGIVSGVTSALLPLAFDIADISMAVNNIIRCSDKNSTCAASELRNSWTSIGISSASLVFTLGALISAPAGLALDIALHFVSTGIFSYYEISDMLEKGVDLDHGHRTEIVMSKLFPMLKLRKEIQLAGEKAEMINSVNEKMSELLRNNNKYSGVIFHQNFKQQCFLDLRKKRNIVVSKAQGRHFSNLTSCPAAYDKSRTTICPSYFLGYQVGGWESPKSCGVDLEGESEHNYFCLGCSFLLNTTHIIDSLRTILVLTNGMVNKSKIFLSPFESAISSQQIVYEISHPLQNFSNVDIYINHRSIIKFELPNEGVFEGTLRFSSNITLLLYWEKSDKSRKVEMQSYVNSFNGTFTTFLVLRGNDHLLEGNLENVTEINAQVLGDANEAEHVDCSAMSVHLPNVLVNTRGGISTHKPDRIKNCPTTYCTGFCTLIFNKNGSYNFVAETINGTIPLDSRIYIKKGEVKATLPGLNLINVKITMKQKKTTYANASVLEIIIHEKVDINLIVTYWIEDEEESNIPLKLVDNVSSVSFQLSDDKLILTRHVFYEQKCPVTGGVVSLELIPKTELWDFENWSKLHFNDCLIFFNNASPELKFIEYH